MGIEDIKILWHDSIAIEWWKMLLIGLFFLALNLCIFLAMWYVRRGSIIEYGYPKRNKKSIKKKLASYSFWDNLFLLRLCREAERKGPMLWICLMCHYICMIAAGASFIGFVGCMLTLADGWAIMLLVVPELAALFITVSIQFIPDLIWLPSERKRYKF